MWVPPADGLRFYIVSTPDCASARLVLVPVRCAGRDTTKGLLLRLRTAPAKFALSFCCCVSAVRSASVRGERRYCHRCHPGRGFLVMSEDTHEASCSVSESPASWHLELPVCSTSASGAPLQLNSSCTEPVHIFVKRRPEQQAHHGGNQHWDGKLWRHLLPIQDASPAGRGA